MSGEDGPKSMAISGLLCEGEEKGMEMNTAEEKERGFVSGKPNESPSLSLGGMSGVSCLSPSLSDSGRRSLSSGKRENWKEDEHERFKMALEKYGRNWKMVEREVQTRTAKQIRSHAQKYFLRLVREQSEDQHRIPKARKWTSRKLGGDAKKSGSSSNTVPRSETAGISSMSSPAISSPDVSHSSPDFGWYGDKSPRLGSDRHGYSPMSYGPQSPSMSFYQYDNYSHGYPHNCNSPSTHNAYNRHSPPIGMPREMMQQHAPPVQQCGFFYQPMYHHCDCAHHHGMDAPPGVSPLVVPPGSSPVVASPGMASPSVPSPGMHSPGMPSPGMPSPGMASPGVPAYPPMPQSNDPRYLFELHRRQNGLPPVPTFANNRGSHHERGSHQNILENFHGHRQAMNAKLQQSAESRGGNLPQQMGSGVEDVPRDKKDAPANERMAGTSAEEKSSIVKPEPTVLRPPTEVKRPEKPEPKSSAISKHSSTAGKQRSIDSHAAKMQQPALASRGQRQQAPIDQSSTQLSLLLNAVKEIEKVEVSSPSTGPLQSDAK
uniref:Uncharacterized protein n=1 Tax=Rhodosorus marinus TaxID=101924 RepID=A0A7S2ZA99_9RHOD|mmetsp:Transcript_11688/g.48591  ORF Transcript_11688/g.48591 Transcript_11688/m.48591 type:complete len:545 (+) Transcript_11688:193-1827(+)